MSSHAISSALETPILASTRSILIYVASLIRLAFPLPTDRDVVLLEILVEIQLVRVLADTKAATVAAVSRVPFAKATDVSSTAHRRSQRPS